jgi:hypothetical protein
MIKLGWKISNSSLVIWSTLTSTLLELKSKFSKISWFWSFQKFCCFFKDFLVFKFSKRFAWFSSFEKKLGFEVFQRFCWFWLMSTVWSWSHSEFFSCVCVRERERERESVLSNKHKILSRRFKQICSALSDELTSQRAFDAVCLCLRSRYTYFSPLELLLICRRSLLQFSPRSKERTWRMTEKKRESMYDAPCCAALFIR